LLVGQSDFVAAIGNVEVIGGGHGVRKTRGSPILKTPPTRSLPIGAVNGDLARAIPVELGGGFVQRGIVED